MIIACLKTNESLLIVGVLISTLGIIIVNNEVDM